MTPRPSRRRFLAGAAAVAAEAVVLGAGGAAFARPARPHTPATTVPAFPGRHPLTALPGPMGQPGIRRQTARGRWRITAKTHRRTGGT